VIKSFFKRFILIINCDVGDLVNLVKSLYAVFDELAQFDSGFDCVGDALDNDDATSVIGLVEEVVGTLEVSADADLSLDADFVGGESFLGLLDSFILVSHVIVNFY